ncbi:hypothetical protein Ccrd_024804 [Cynara cardunculus var. scolymus]|uniref:SWIM-type domain-containing protein n=1 Tax=Cynara cardunculus var. scolymus TaxID=59895 RepID=A0A118JSD5_CYNCS|nr:hypothetical protein Ccrd_024804 [Cynara cardunculus var. scolymus]
MNTTTLTFKTNTLIEYHAAKVYTRVIFFKVQKEIFKGYRCCSQWQVNSEMGFTVAQSHSDDSIYCDCRHFKYYGTLCRHVFTVLFNLDFDEIPQQYILRRWMRGHSCDEEKLTAFLDNIRSWKSNLLSGVSEKLDFTNKDDVLQSLVGVPRPEKIDILPPQGIRNKGCGTSKRLIGAGERAMTKSKRPKRLCRGCKELVHHDIRNCPVRKASSN